MNHWNLFFTSIISSIYIYLIKLQVVFQIWPSDAMVIQTWYHGHSNLIPTMWSMCTVSGCHFGENADERERERYIYIYIWFHSFSFSQPSNLASACGAGTDLSSICHLSVCYCSVVIKLARVHLLYTFAVLVLAAIKKLAHGQFVP